MDMIDEIWKPIPNYPNYEISNYGRVKSLNYRMKGYAQVLKLNPDTDGYYQLGIRNGSLKTVKAHALVAQMFIGERPSPKHHVNHIDGDKTNNHVSNLEYCTPSENARHAVDMGLYKPRMGEKHGKAILTKKDVIDIREYYEKNKQKKRWGATKLAMEYGVSITAISDIANRRRWNHI